MIDINNITGIHRQDIGEMDLYLLESQFFWLWT